VKRNTRQRELLRAVFVAAKRPLSPQEIVEAAQVELPSLGIATVYRALKEFVDEGWLTSVAVAGSVRYELAEIGHHHHFHCQDCDKTYDIDGCAGDLTRLVPHGFVVANHELTLSGTCCACASQNGTVKARR
jgi:Fur family ferric uptake transcriptional regulator